MTGHNDTAKEWGALSDRAINPSAISYEPKINSRAVQGERNGSNARVATIEQNGEEQDGEEGATRQETVPEESRADVSVHGCWKWGTTAIFDMKIVNLDAGSYLSQTSANALATEEKDKKDKYLQPCLERRCSFTTMVYSVDGIPGTEAVAAHQCLSLLLSNKLKQEYL